MTELPERDDFGDYGQWPGRAVLDPSGRPLGEIREIYLDDATDQPEWVLVDLGDDGARFVPLADATVAEDAIKVAQESDRVGAAPTLEPSKELTQAEERRLYDHYGLRYSEDASDSLLPDPGQPPAGDTGAAAKADAGEDAAAGTEAAALPPTPPSDGEDRPRPEAAGPGEGEAPTAARPKLRRYVGPESQLPAAGETSEPADSGPMVPPRPEPVSPPRFEAEPEGGGPLALVRRKPVPVAAGVAAAVAVVLLILLRRR